MRAGACLCALLAALALASCVPPPQSPSTPSAKPARESERPPGALPDAYKHPPK
jgi:hypothetical protein